MQAVDLDPPFARRSNPIQWINAWLVSDNVQVAPQEVEVSSYLVGLTDSEGNTDNMDLFKTVLNRSNSFSLSLETWTSINPTISISQT
jgi:hypothetical protein